jgi:hypothetical protein
LIVATDATTACCMSALVINLHRSSSSIRTNTNLEKDMLISTKTPLQEKHQCYWSKNFIYCYFLWFSSNTKIHNQLNVLPNQFNIVGISCKWMHSPHLRKSCRLMPESLKCEHPPKRFGSF